MPVLKNTTMPSDVEIQILEHYGLARTDQKNPFTVTPEDSWEDVWVNLQEWLPKLAILCQASDSDVNPDWKDGDPETRSLLPPVILCNKERRAVAAVPYNDFPDGNRIIRNSKNKAKSGFVNTTIVFGTCNVTG
jgi:hypothetical protein